MAAEDALGIRVLVVSDDPHIVEEARFAFPGDVAVRFARDSREAKLQLADGNCDVVVVDLQTGSAGGYDLRKDMQYTGSATSIPLLLLLEREQDAWLAAQSGASAYKVKPLDPGELARTVLDLCSS
nr:response regulator transcription factor [Actinomycetota bacterium]